jgi:broad-specificity NMP kinase
MCDFLEEVVGGTRGTVVDYHSCDFFPERWFDLVIVLTCNNTLLYDRLEARGYKSNKVQENVECEIMQVVVNDALDSYREEIVVVRSSEDVQDIEDTVERVKAWVDVFRMQGKEVATASIPHIFSA